MMNFGITDHPRAVLLDLSAIARKEKGLNTEIIIE